MTPDEIKQEARELVEKLYRARGPFHPNDTNTYIDAIESFGQRCFEAGRIAALPSEDEISEAASKHHPRAFAHERMSFLDGVRWLRKRMGA